MALRFCPMAGQGGDYQGHWGGPGPDTTRKDGAVRFRSPNAMSTSFEPDLARDLRAHLALCEQVMTLTVRENQALAGQSAYQPFEFYQQRKNLLPRLEESLM